jgi:hypothetical protein
VEKNDSSDDLSALTALQQALFNGAKLLNLHRILAVIKQQKARRKG